MVTGRLASLIAGLTLGAVLHGCGADIPEFQHPPYRAVGFDALQDWRADDLDGVAPALSRSCTRLGRFDADKRFGTDELPVLVADWQPICAALAEIDAADDDDLRDFLESNFVPVAVDLPESEGLFTGYYEPQLYGARWPGGQYVVPLYRAPEDMVRNGGEVFRQGKDTDGKDALLPYYTRAEIDEGVLDGRNLELVWLNDPVDAFFLHIQGSGQVVLPGGETMRVGFAGHNGHPFYAIGRALLDMDVLEPGKVSMQAIRDWLREHPEEARALMHRNNRYIFFQEIQGDGPLGSTGVALTALRSMAIDPDRVPYHSPIWLETRWPGEERPMRRLMIAQDTGSAIRGTVRGDIFFGFGEDALAQAGRMKARGRYFILMPRVAVERLAATG